MVEMVIPSPLALTVTFPGCAVGEAAGGPPPDADGTAAPPEAAAASAGRASAVEQTNAAA
jgi:hypothetical protein